MSEFFSDANSSYRPAPLWRRLAAMFYDSLLLVALWLVTTSLFLAAMAAAMGADVLRQLADEGGLNRNPLLGSLLFIVTFFFFAYFWRRLGQTLGMQVWRIRIQTPDGRRIRWTQCILRFMGGLLSALPLGLGYWWMLWDKESKTWHDKYSLSEVVLLPPRKVPKTPSARGKNAQG
jgi:uncharacterized RDD family membrane protein YckC